MNVRAATASDKPKIKYIWKTCFGDSDSYIDFYLQNGFANNTTFLAEKNGEPVAMLTAIDTEFQDENNREKGSYFYALATLPQYQKQGIMGKLEEQVAALKEQEGCRFACLSPATKKLQDYYLKKGYSFSGGKEVKTVQKAGSANTLSAFGEIGKKAFLQEREKFLQSKGRSFCFAKPMDSYIYDEAQFTGCKMYRGTIGDKVGYLACYIDDNKVYIQESSFPFEELKGSISYFEKMFQAKELQVMCFQDKPGDKTAPYFMVKPLNGNSASQYAGAYINFVLD